MIFLPLIFVCLTDGVTCQFGILKATNDLNKCIVQIQETSKELENNPVVGVFRATCAEVNDVTLKGKDI
jgi:hypothetical protein